MNDQEGVLVGPNNWAENLNVALGGYSNRNDEDDSFFEFYDRLSPPELLQDEQGQVAVEEGLGQAIQAQDAQQQGEVLFHPPLPFVEVPALADVQVVDAAPGDQVPVPQVPGPVLAGLPLDLLEIIRIIHEQATTNVQIQDDVGEVRVPRPMDILWGPGGHARENPGNQRFRQIVDTGIHEYLRANKAQKTRLAWQYTNYFLIVEDDVMFLKRDKDDEYIWRVIHNNDVRQKVTERFRLLRRQMIANGELLL